MNYESFCWWLHGFFEISKTEELTKEQVQEIKNHLDLLFNKITPNLMSSWASVLDKKEIKLCGDKMEDYRPPSGGIRLENNNSHNLDQNMIDAIFCKPLCNASC